MITDETVESTLRNLLKEQNGAVETLTTNQFCEAVLQAISAGDFRRLVTTDGAQSVNYIPFRELESLRAKYYELIYAVATKHDGETRHETALRYIKERENKTQNFGSVQENQTIQ